MPSPTRILFLTLCFVLLAACSSQTESSTPGATSAPAPPFDRNDSIKTYADYDKALKAARKNLPASLHQSVGTRHAAACIAELAKLPSAPARRYTQSLIDTARRHNVAIPDLPPSPTPPPYMTYTELAQLEALSMAIIDSRDKDDFPVSPDQKLPRDLRVDLLLAIAAQSPGDISSMSAATAPFNPLPGDQQGGDPNADPALRRARNKKLFDDAFNRYLDPRRPLNLSSLRLFDEMKLTALAMLFYYYAYTIESPSGHDLKDLASGLKSASSRARSVDHSAETRKVLDEFVKDLDEKRDFIENFDYNIHIAAEVGPTIQKFFVALHADDRAALRTILDPRLYNWIGVIEANLAATKVPNFKFEVHGAAGDVKGGIIIDYHTTLNEAKHEPGGTSALVKKQGDRWIITEIANVTGK